MESASAIEQTVSNCRQTKNIFEYLEFYSNNGLRVIPVHYPQENGLCSCGSVECSSIGKHPAIGGNWPEKATTNKTLLDLRWGRKPNYNVGIVTGRESGVIVLDVDEDEGFQLIEEKNEIDPSTKDTFVVQTGGGGLHLYYEYPNPEDTDLERIKNSVRKIPGCDIRADDGFVVAPPSLHYSGNRYEILSNKPIGKCPKWLLEEIKKNDRFKKKVPTASFNESINKKLSTQSSGESGLIPEGQRNDTIFTLGSLWIRQNHHNERSLFSVLSAFNNGGTAEPLSTYEINAMYKSILGHTIDIRDGLGDDDTLYEFCTREETKNGKTIRVIDDYQCAEAFSIMHPTITEKRTGASHAIWTYDEGIYQLEYVQHFFNRLKRIFKNGFTGGNEANIIKSLYALTMPLKPIEFNPDPYMVCVENKVINLRTSEVLDQCPEFLLTTKLPIFYDPNAKCSEIVKFIWDITEDPTTAQLLVDLFVVSSIRKIIKQWFMMTGGGDNGKTQFVDILLKFIGRYNSVTSSLERINNNRFGTYDLYNKLLVLLPEEPGRVQNIATLKAIVGEDPIIAEQKNKDPFQFVPFCTPIITSNDPPIYEEAGDAVKGRTTLIDLPFTFKLNPTGDQKQAIKNIAEKIATPEELSGLLNLVIKSAPRVIKNMSPLRTDLHRYDAYYSKLASMDRFVELFCEFINVEDIKAYEDFEYLSSTELHEPYAEFCRINNVEPKSVDRFSKFLAKDRRYLQFRHYGKRCANIFFNRALFHSHLNRRGEKPSYRENQLRKLGVCDEIIDIWKKSGDQPSTPVIRKCFRFLTSGDLQSKAYKIEEGLRSIWD